MPLLKLFGRGFLIVGLQACSVVAVSGHHVAGAFAASYGISAVWWGNVAAVNCRDQKWAREAYCAGAAIGSALVAWVTR